MRPWKDMIKVFKAFYGTYVNIEHEYPPTSKPESTYNRDIGYSLYRRSFTERCAMLDIDVVETRGGKPKLLYELKTGARFNIKRYTGSYSYNIYKTVARALCIPFAVVEPKYDMSEFTVHWIDTSQNKHGYEKRVYTEPEWREIIESLGSAPVRHTQTTLSTFDVE